MLIAAMSIPALADTPPASEPVVEQSAVGEAPATATSDPDASVAPEEVSQKPEQDTEEPAAEEPAEEPAAERPAADEPAAAEPAAEEPSAAEESSAGEPAGEDPVAEEPAAGQSAEEPAAEEPAAEEPAAEEPSAAGEPSAGEPAGGGLAAEEPSAVGEPSAPEADWPADPVPVPRIVPATVTVAPSAGSSGEVTFTATVHGDAGNPTGTVTFTTVPDVGGCAPVTVVSSGANDATATCPITIGSGQLVTVTADYSGDGTYPGPVSGSVNYQAKRVPTVGVMPSGAGVSGTVRFTATVFASVPIPTGTVDFSTTGPAGCTDVPLGSGPFNAICDITIAPGAAVTVTATYSGDATGYEQASGQTTYQALLRPTVTVKPTGGGPAGSITFTATVTGTGPAPPSGTVTFDTGGPAVCSLPVTGTPPVATCDIAVAVAEQVTVTAAYAGDSAYEPATATATYTGQLTPTIDVEPAGSVPAGTVTVTATVSGVDLAAGQTAFVGPSGQVTFSVGGTVVCNQVTLADGVATCGVPVGPAQQVTVTAAYLGDGTFHGVTGSTTLFGLIVPVVTVYSQAENNQGPAGDQDFSITVVGPTEAPTPTGSVTVTALIGSTSLTTSCDPLAPASAGTASAECHVDDIPQNAEVLITGTYSGDATYAGASGSIKYQTPTAMVSVVVTAPPGATAGDVPFTAIVTSSDGQQPTGTVTLSLQGAATFGVSALAGNSCTATLLPGPGPNQANGTCPLTVPAGQTVSVVAAYSGSGHYYVNTTPTAVAYQGKRTPAVTLAVGPASPVPVGTAVTLTARVGADSSGTAPTGTVRFEASGAAIAGCESVPVSGGQAVCTTSALPAGSLQLAASYSGDGAYLPGSAGTADYVVTGASTLSSVSSGLPATGADVRTLLISALLLLLAGSVIVAIGYGDARGHRACRH